MAETSALFSKAQQLLNDSTDAESAAKAANLLQIAASIANLEAQTSKLAAENAQALDALASAKADRRTAGWKYLVTQAGPLLTVLVLAGTLILQTAQFRDADRQKEIDRQNSAWSDAVKAMGGANTQAAWIAIQPFLQSSQYGAQARQIATQLIEKSTDPQVFNAIYEQRYGPLTWQNLPDVLNLDRALGQSDITLSDVMKQHTLTAEQRAELNYTDKAVQQISTQLAVFLRSPRGSHSLDLSNGYLWSADFSGANLQGANLTGTYGDHINLSGANLAGVTSFSNLFWPRVAWWQAGRIDPPLLHYLTAHFPYSSSVDYGTPMEPTASQYVASVARLRARANDNAVDTRAVTTKP